MQGGGLVNAVAGPQGQRQEQMVKGLGQIAKQLPGAGMMESMAGAFKSGGIMGVMGAGIAGIMGFVKQIMESSKVFQGIAGSFFKIFGAMADVFLLPFLPLAMKGMQMLLQQMPRMAEWGQKAAEWTEKAVGWFKTMFDNMKQQGFWQGLWMSIGPPIMEGVSKIVSAITLGVKKEQVYSADPVTGDVDVDVERTRALREKQAAETEKRKSSYTLMQQLTLQGEWQGSGTLRWLANTLMGEKLRGRMPGGEGFQQAQPGMQLGGVVPGGPGQGVNTTLHGGELVIPRSTVASMESAKGNVLGGFFGNLGQLIAEEASAINSFVQDFKQKEMGAGGTLNRWEKSTLEGSVPRTWDYLAGMYGHMSDEAADQAANAKSALDSMGGLKLPNIGDISIPEIKIPDISICLDRLGNCLNQSFGIISRQAQTAVSAIQEQTTRGVDLNVVLPEMPSRIDISAGSNVGVAAASFGNAVGGLFSSAESGISSTEQRIRSAASNVANIIRSAGVSFNDSWASRLSPVAAQFGGIVKQAGIFLARRSQIRPDVRLAMAGGGVGGGGVGPFDPCAGLSTEDCAQQMATGAVEQEPQREPTPQKDVQALVEEYENRQEMNRSGAMEAEDYDLRNVLGKGTAGQLAYDKAIKDHQEKVLEEKRRSAIISMTGTLWADDDDDDDDNYRGGSNDTSGGSSEPPERSEPAESSYDSGSVSLSDEEEWGWEDDYYSGGIVKGRTGQRRLVRAHGGERILPNSAPGGGARLSSRRTMNITINSRASVTEILGDLERLEAMDEASFFNSTI